MAEELSITKWLDPALEYFARQAGIPAADYSAQVGGEGIGVALEFLADLFTKGWFNKVIQGIAGLFASGYAVFGKDVPVRLRKELLALGTHELLRIVDPKPSDIREVQESIFKFADAVKRGDVNAALASILRTPREVSGLLAAMGVPVGAPSAQAPRQLSVKSPKTSSASKPATKSSGPMLI